MNMLSITVGGVSSCCFLIEEIRNLATGTSQGSGTVKKWSQIQQFLNVQCFIVEFNFNLRSNVIDVDH